jgi:hypothetical protein
MYRLSNHCQKNKSPKKIEAPLAKKRDTLSVLSIIPIIKMPVSTHPQPCDCPFCLLVDANAQLCDIHVGLEQGKNSMTIKAPCEELVSQEVLGAIGRITYVIANAGQKLKKLPKIGDGLDLDDKQYELHLIRKSKHTWKVCFHAKTQTVAVDEDPQ